MTTQSDDSAVPWLGVVLVTYDSTDVILDCLETLLAATGCILRIVVVDNASADGTPEHLRRWAAGEIDAPLAGLPFAVTAARKPIEVHTEAGLTELRDDRHAIALVETGLNMGFAGGVNRGLEVLARIDAIDRFWVLNPDSVVPPDTPPAFATQSVPAAGFALMGGRVLYLDDPQMIQIDGGIVDRRTGITGNLGLYASHADTPPSDPASMDFITGASMVASRAFYETTGPMREDYFLYYEEVDWALRRGDLPLAYCAKGVVYHHGGSAIGSATHNRPASPFALYFKHRARMMFQRRFFPGYRATAHVWTLAKAGQFMAKGYVPEALALLAGALGRPPPKSVRARLSPAVLRHISGILK